MNRFEDVAEVISRTADGNGITPEQELKEDLGLDSLSLVSVIVGLEEKFSVQFDESDLDPSKIVQVKDLVRLVEKYV